MPPRLNTGVYIISRPDCVGVCGGFSVIGPRLRAATPAQGRLNPGGSLMMSITPLTPPPEVGARISGEGNRL